MRFSCFKSREFSGFTILVWTFFVLTMITLPACSSKKKAHRTYTEDSYIKADLQIEKEVEKDLHGTELLIVKSAFEWEGTPYAFGRQDKGVATDCSGMVMVVFEEVLGCKLPRNSAKQAEYCEEIKSSKVKPADLVFFITNNGDKINHVGIMIDEEQFIHASTKGVRVSSMASDYYKNHFVKYGRVPCLKH